MQIIDMQALDEAFRRILHKEALLDVAEAILGTPNIRLYHDQGLFKPPRIGDEVPWHQDNGYWKLEPPGAASCWIALDDATLENGCMWVVPGSHKAGLAGHMRAGQYIAQYERKRFVRLSAADPRALVELDRLAFSLASPPFEPVELSPVCPLGTNSVVAPVDQNITVATIRNTEVVSDATNVLALECAL